MSTIKKKYAGKVFAAAVIINLVVGITYIWSIINKELMTAYGWSARQASLPYMMALAVMPLSMMVGGSISDNGKPKKSAVIGSILWGAGLIICGLTHSQLMITVGYGVFFGVGVGFITGTTTATAAKWYPDEKKGSVSGIASAAIGFSSVYMSFLLTALMDRFGLSNSLLIVGIAGMLIMLAGSMFMKSPDEEAGSEKAAASEVSHEKDCAWKDMLRTSEFWKLWIIFALGDSGALMLIGSMASIVNVQAGIENAALHVMLINLFNSVGRVSVGALSDRIGIRRAFRLSLAIQLINMLLFSHYTTYVSLLIGASLAGFSFGGIIAMLTPSASRFGETHLAMNAAVVNTAYSAGAIVMPYVAAYIVDVTGAYSFSYLVAAVMLAAAIILTFFYKAERVEKTQLHGLPSTLPRLLRSFR